MCVRRIILKILPDLRRNEYRGNPSAGGLGNAAAGLGPMAFVPSENDEVGFAAGFQYGVEFIDLLF